jgi:hypothetical protein
MGMINSAAEWLEILFFALLVGCICIVIVLIALAMGCVYCIKAVYESDFRWIIE